MSLATVYSRALIGIKAWAVTVEVHLAPGLPSLSIVGLPATSVKESKDRVRSAILNSRFEFPLRRITINLAPADLPKDGGCYDLPVAIGILLASGQLPAEAAQQCEFIGELSLSGQLRSVKGVLAIALEVAKTKRYLVLPRDNTDEAALIKDIKLLPITHLGMICAHLSGDQQIRQHHYPVPDSLSSINKDIGEVHNQSHAKRALTIAAAGAHNLLMIGPPGAGKTMLAERLPSILPPMSEKEALESAAIHSIYQYDFDVGHWRERPFRSPHHTSSNIALIGGGHRPLPGEISLAHHGVLFLDELPEFKRGALEGLREPLESGRIHISRATYHVEYPARFQLIAAMNPCPCGFFGDGSHRCHCTAEQIHRYRSRISGPILDRIDMIITIPNISTKILVQAGHGKPSESPALQKRITATRQRQIGRSDKLNSQLEHHELQQVCTLTPSYRQLLEKAARKFNLSTRSIYRIMRVARTIADLNDHDKLELADLTEAIGYRKTS